MAGGGEDQGALPGLDGEGIPPSRQPLAARMRPVCLAEVVGHRRLLGEGALLPRLIQGDAFGSLILHGPPGCGKTTLAEVIARETGCRVVRVNAVLSGAPELREILQEARRHPERRTLLVIDEIHRFNKAQQDLLLPDVESGAVRLIGCTTHNPGHHVNPALLSRSHLLRLEPLGREEVAAFLGRALSDAERGLGKIRVGASPEVLGMLADLAEGDLRRALNALETLALGTPVGTSITPESIRRYALERRIRFDDGGDDHYDTISAFIKSIRGSDPDAAMYWLALMLEGGEDPRFIARRLVIAASEDIGLADSRGLGLAVAAHQASELLGLPEAEYPLAHATLFLALAPKGNSATRALAAAREAVRGRPRQEVPTHLRDGHGALARRLGVGGDYVYPHGHPENVTGQPHLASPLELFEPGDAGAEAALAERLTRLRRLRAELGRRPAAGA
jgi:putative ATPase